jgi:hypothetical protein
MNSVVKPVRATGSIGVVGVFVVEDPAPEDTLMQKGQLAFDFCTSGKEKNQARRRFDGAVWFVSSPVCS